MYDSFYFGWPTIYNSIEQAFLSSMIGSAYGEWIIKRYFEKDVFKICRHEPGNKRVYADPDREWLYKRDADGFLEFR